MKSSLSEGLLKFAFVLCGLLALAVVFLILRYVIKRYTSCCGPPPQPLEDPENPEEEDIPPAVNRDTHRSTVLQYVYYTIGRHFKVKSRLKILQEFKPNSKCSICLRSYRSHRNPEDEVIIALVKKCNHYFHFECLWDWFNVQRQKKQKPSCPLCRSSVGRLSQHIEAITLGAIIRYNARVAKKRKRKHKQKKDRKKWKNEAVDQVAVDYTDQQNSRDIIRGFYLKNNQSLHSKPSEQDTNQNLSQLKSAHVEQVPNPYSDSNCGAQDQENVQQVSSIQLQLENVDSVFDIDKCRKWLSTCEFPVTSDIEVDGEQVTMSRIRINQTEKGTVKVSIRNIQV